MKKLIKEYRNFLKERIKGDKIVFAIELIYVLFCISSAIYFATQGKIQNMVMSFVFPVIVLAVNLVEWKAKMRGGAVFYLFFFAMSTSNILGNGYGFYALFYPYFDKVMHTLSGIVFTCLGYSIIKVILEGDDGKKFVYCLIAGLIFAMAIASIWEVYEYFVSEVLHDDMQTNYIVNTIDYEKYIYQTYIYYTDGSSEIVDGYIDVGLFDTLQDIMVCLCGSLVTIGLLVLDNFCFRRAINRLIVPVSLKIDGDELSVKSEKLITDQKTA